jgi:hypothetical protein
MDGRRIIKNMIKLSKGNHSKYFKKFGRANDKVYESIRARFIGTLEVTIMVEDSIRPSIRKNQYII